MLSLCGEREMPRLLPRARECYGLALIALASQLERGKGSQRVTPLAPAPGA